MGKPDAEQDRWEELDVVLQEFWEDITRVSPPPVFDPHERPTVDIPVDQLERLRKGLG